MTSSSSYQNLIIFLSCSYDIQSETSSLVTRTPHFAAPKLSAAEVGPVMLSSLPAKRYDDNYDSEHLVFPTEQLSIGAAAKPTSEMPNILLLLPCLHAADGGHSMIQLINSLSF